MTPVALVTGAGRGIGRGIAATLAVVLLLSLAQGASAQDKAVQIDELMSLYHRYGLFNGSVPVAEGSRVIYKKGFGLAHMEWNIPNQPDMTWVVLVIAAGVAVETPIDPIIEGTRTDYKGLPRRP